MIDGGADNDKIRGDQGNDRLTGGSGADLFIFDLGVSSGDYDTITDYVVGVDSLDVTGANSANISNVAGGAEVVFQNTTDTLTVFFEGLTAAELEADTSLLFFLP